MGLEKHDLDNLLVPIFGIDLYKPKTGSEDEIAIISFTVENELLSLIHI